MFRMLSVLAVLCGVSMALAADDPPAIKDVMVKAHKPNMLRAQIATALKSADPDFAGLQKLTKEYVTLASALPLGTPPKGEKEEFKKKAAAFVVDVKAVDVAVGRSNATAAAAALEKSGTHCMNCHKAHRN